MSSLKKQTALAACGLLLAGAVFCIQPLALSASEIETVPAAGEITSEGVPNIESTETVQPDEKGYVPFGPYENSFMPGHLKASLGSWAFTVEAQEDTWLNTFYVPGTLSEVNSFPFKLRNVESGKIYELDERYPSNRAGVRYGKRYTEYFSAGKVIDPQSPYRRLPYGTYEFVFADKELEKTHGFMYVELKPQYLPSNKGSIAVAPDISGKSPRIVIDASQDFPFASPDIAFKQKAHLDLVQIPFIAPKKKISLKLIDDSSKQVAGAGVLSSAFTKINAYPDLLSAPSYYYLLSPAEFSKVAQYEASALDFNKGADDISWVMPMRPYTLVELDSSKLPEGYHLASAEDTNFKLQEPGSKGYTNRLSDKLHIYYAPGKIKEGLARLEKSNRKIEIKSNGLIYEGDKVSAVVAAPAWGVDSIALQFHMVKHSDLVEALKEAEDVKGSPCYAKAEEAPKQQLDEAIKEVKDKLDDLTSSASQEEVDALTKKLEDAYEALPCKDEEPGEPGNPGGEDGSGKPEVGAVPGETGKPGTELNDTSPNPAKTAGTDLDSLGPATKTQFEKKSVYAKRYLPKTGKGKPATLYMLVSAGVFLMSLGLIFSVRFKGGVLRKR